MQQMVYKWNYLNPNRILFQRELNQPHFLEFLRALRQKFFQCYQWNWDSAFAAWGFSVFDTKRAWQEIETLFAGQWPNGMLPHILFRQDDPDYFPGPTVWGTEGIGPISSSGILSLIHI